MTEMTEQQIEEFKSYLTDRLIPDLQESALPQLAADYITCVEIIEELQQELQQELSISSGQRDAGERTD